jgi:hypothetical protein
MIVFVSYRILSYRILCCNPSRYPVQRADARPHQPIRIRSHQRRMAQGESTAHRARWSLVSVPVALVQHLRRSKDHFGRGVRLGLHFGPLPCSRRAASRLRRPERVLPRGNVNLGAVPGSLFHLYALKWLHVGSRLLCAERRSCDSRHRVFSPFCSSGQG